MDIGNELMTMVIEEGMGPLFTEMPRLSLADKLIAGPTAAHRIEEVHTPLNLAYITFSTGSSSFQNLVGVTFAELPARVRAAQKMFELAGIREQSKVLFCYPPLINLFTAEFFREMRIAPMLLPRPSRDALLAMAVKEQPQVIFGEGAFLLSWIRDAMKLGMISYLPKDLVLVAAGTPFPEELAEEIGKLPGKAAAHDLYGCQEYGVLTLDGVPLREDISLLEDAAEKGFCHLLAGGLPTGDLFLKGEHILNREGHILTYTGKRAEQEPEVLVTAVTALNRDTAVRTCRGILRLKGHVVRAAEELVCGAEATKVTVKTRDGKTAELEGPQTTGLFDELLQAQMDYQKYQKADPVWNKQR